MKSIKELAPKPSDAIQAMIDGLKNYNSKPGFNIDMGTYGRAVKGICFGCAATCTIQQIAGEDIPENNIHSLKDHAYALDFDIREVIDFEFAIDSFRSNDVSPLFYFYGKENPIGLYTDWFLDTDNFMEQLPLVQEYCDQLKQMGL